VAYAQRKTLKNGTVRWYARYLGDDGKYHVEGGFPNEREALRIANQREEEARRGEWVDPRNARMTFTKFVDDHYWPTAKHLEVSTKAAYRCYLNKHFLPTFGSMPMRRVSATSVQSWVNDAVVAGLSARTVVKYHALLHKIFARAVVERIVPVNPCSHTELPKVVRTNRRIVTPVEFDAVLEKIDQRYRMLLLLDIETGLRWGEIVALRPCDIDFTTHVVRVRRTLVEVAKKESPAGERIFVKDYPKSNEPRLVQIEPSTCALLKRHMLAHGVRDDDLLFTSSIGTPISRNNFRSKVWLTAVEDAELDRHITFHDLRAAHASWLLAGGADLQVVKERLGHSQITTTQQYLGTLPDAGDKALTALRRIRAGS
jgi:integrase